MNKEFQELKRRYLELNLQIIDMEEQLKKSKEQLDEIFQEMKKNLIDRVSEFEDDENSQYLKDIIENADNVETLFEIDGMLNLARSTRRLTDIAKLCRERMGL